jgi:hypothetical protein
MKRHISADPQPNVQPVSVNSQENRAQTTSNDDFAQLAEREIQKALQSFATQHDSGNGKQQNGGMQVPVSNKLTY